MAFVGHQILAQFHQPPAWMRNYWDDVLSLPIIFVLTLTLMRRIYKKPQLQLPIRTLVAGSIYWAVLFEELIPYYFDTSTADRWDYLAYLIGALGFIFVGKREGWVTGGAIVKS